MHLAMYRCLLFPSLSIANVMLLRTYNMILLNSLTPQNAVQRYISSFIWQSFPD